MKPYRRSYLAGSLLIAASSVASAAPADLAARSSGRQLRTLGAAAPEGAGPAVAIIGPRSVVSAKGYGYANVERVPVTDETIFQWVGRQAVHGGRRHDAGRGGRSVARRPNHQILHRRARVVARDHRPQPADAPSGIPEYTNEGGGAAAVDLRRDYTKPRCSTSRTRCHSTSSLGRDGATATPAT